MKEKYLLFKDGTKKRIIKESPTIVNDKRWACDTREYVTSDGTVYKLFYSMTEGDHWCERCVSDPGGEEYYVYRKNIDEVIEEDNKLVNDFAVNVYCMNNGKLCTHCSAEVGGYCCCRSTDPLKVMEHLNKHIMKLEDKWKYQAKEIEHLESKCEDQEKEIEDLISSNNHLIEQAKTLNKEKDELKEKVNVYNNEIKQWLNGFYGQPLQPLYCYTGMRSGGKTLFTENEKLKKELEYYKERCGNQKTELMENQKYIKKVVSDRNDYKQALRILGSDVFIYKVYRSLDGSAIYRMDSTIRAEDQYQFVEDMINKAIM